MPVMRIPYTEPLPAPRIIPSAAQSLEGAITALTRFLSHGNTVLLTGAGISTASGLADYRGKGGTYTVNKTYRPIYYNEFTGRHESRKRYWARSFLGSVNLGKARPNDCHHAVAQLGHGGLINEVITQNVDSFHSKAHPLLRTTELHGYLRSAVCLSCRSEMPRAQLQAEFRRLNPTWTAFLKEIEASGALDTEDPAERQRRGLKTNPDGDVDVGGGVDYATFRYPPCSVCLATPFRRTDGTQEKIAVDEDGAWMSDSTGGVLKPAVIMFGESISEPVKLAAEEAIDGAGRLLVMGSSLATYSAWRLAQRASRLGLPIGILNIGGVRGEEAFFKHVGAGEEGDTAVRCEGRAEVIMPEVARRLL